MTTQATESHRQAVLIHQSDRVDKKVVQGTSFTVPETVNTVSPSGVHGSKPVSGGLVHSVSSNDAGVVEMATFKPIQLRPGDVVATAVNSHVLTVTINGVERYRVVGTALTAAQAMLWYA